MDAFNDNKRYYIPLNHWQDIMSKQAIRTILPCFVKNSADEFHNEKLNALLEVLLGTKDTLDSKAPLSYRKVLAILILIGKASAIELFVKERISDMNILLMRVQKNLDEKRLFSLCKGELGQDLACFQNWEQCNI